MTLPQPSQKFWVVTITLIIIGALFLYYFKVYIPKREEALNGEKRREIERIGKNLLQKRMEYDKNINNLISSYDVEKKDYSDLTDVLVSQFNLDRKSVMNQFYGRADNQYKKELKNLSVYSTGLKDIKQISQKEDSIIFKSNKKFSKEKLDLFSVSIGEFIEGFYNSRMHFDEFIIIRVFRYGGNPSISKVGFQTLNNQVRMDSLDIFLETESGLQSVAYIENLKLGDIGYKMFSHRINFNNFISSDTLESDNLEENWILCGLMKSSNYDGKVRAVEPIVIVFLALAGIFLLIAMPVLKLLVMSSIERLQITNVWFVGFSVVVGTAILTALLIFSNSFFGSQEKSDAKLKKLATLIDNKFNNEVMKVIMQLDSLDISVYYAMKLKANELRKLEAIKKRIADLKLSNKHSTSDSKLIQEFEIANKEVKDKNLIGIDVNRFLKKVNDLGIKTPTIDAINNAYLVSNVLDNNSFGNIIQPYKFYNEAFWLAADGTQKLAVFTHGGIINRVAPNLGHRRYFQNANEGANLFYSRDSKISYSLQSIRSNRNQTTEVGIGIKANSIPEISVVALATKLHSVMNPLLPSGYSFCLIDEAGLVWFHSDRNLNLQENFFEETENQNALITAVKGRIKMPLTIRYRDNPNRVYIKPLQNTPLTLVVLQDKGYYAAPHIVDLTYTFSMILALFFLMGTHILILYVVTFRSTKLKIKRFFLSWLRPRTKWLADKDKVETAILSGPYGKSIFLQCILFLVCILLFFSSSATWVGLVFFVLPIYLLWFHYVLFEVETIRNRDDRNKKWSNRRWIGFTTGTFVLLLLIHLAVDGFVDNIIGAVVIEVVVTILMTLLIYMKEFRLFVPQKRGVGLALWMRKGTRPYLIFMRLWLVLVAVLPVFFFYKLAYHNEIQNWTKHELLKTAREAEKRDAHYLKELKNELGLFTLKTSPSEDKLYNEYINHRDTYGSYIENCFGIEEVESFIGTPIDPSRLSDLLFRFHINSDSVMGESRQTIYPQASDSSWMWYKYGDQVGIRYLDDNNQPRYFLSSLPQFSLAGDYWILFSILFVVFAFVINRAVRFSVKFVFGVGLISKEWGYQKKNNDFLNSIKSGSTNKVILIGLPHSTKSKDLELFIAANTKKNERDSAGYNFQELDFGNPEFQRYSKNPDTFYIIRHFELSINNHKENKDRYEIIRRLMEVENSRIIITSSVQPSVIFDFYDASIEQVMMERRQEGSELIAEYKKYIRLWKNLLSGFVLEYAPLNWSPPVDLHIIPQELRQGTYLPMLKSKWVQNDKLTIGQYPTIDDEEDFILEVEEYADTYYHSLWNSFSEKEKFLLYDLAVDRFVNMRNLKLIRVLMHKGVVVMDDSLRIMNKSFNNFIISSVKEDEQLKMEKEVSRSGTWSTVQLVLLIGLIALIAFISIAQENWMENLNALITAFGGVVALLLKFGGLFGGSKTYVADK